MDRNVNVFNAAGHYTDLTRECAVDDTLLLISTPFANVANSMKEGWTCSPTPLPLGEVM